MMEEKYTTNGGKLLWFGKWMTSERQIIVLPLSYLLPIVSSINSTIKSISFKANLKKQRRDIHIHFHPYEINENYYLPTNWLFYWSIQISIHRTWFSICSRYVFATSTFQQSASKFNEEKRFETSNYTLQISTIFNRFAYFMVHGMSWCT